MIALHRGAKTEQPGMSDDSVRGGAAGTAPELPRHTSTKMARPSEGGRGMRHSCDAPQAYCRHPHDEQQPSLTASTCASSPPNPPTIPPSYNPVLCIVRRSHPPLPAAHAARAQNHQVHSILLGVVHHRLAHICKTEPGKRCMGVVNPSTCIA